MEVAEQEYPLRPEQAHRRTVSFLQQIYMEMSTLPHRKNIHFPSWPITQAKQKEWNHFKVSTQRQVASETLVAFF